MKRKFHRTIALIRFGSFCLFNAGRVTSGARNYLFPGLISVDCGRFSIGSFNVLAGA